eukprot:2302043-Rhodomonas_salina.1
MVPVVLSGAMLLPHHDGASTDRGYLLRPGLELGTRDPQSSPRGCQAIPAIILHTLPLAAFVHRMHCPKVPAAPHRARPYQ